MTDPEGSNVATIEEAQKEETKVKTPSEPMKTLLSKIEDIPDPEGKVRATITFMEEALGCQTGVPHFKSFWDARDVCLQLFKENITHQAREVFWERYKELSKEARTLKEMLDKQSAFAVEQFQLALDELEKEIGSFAEYVGKANAIPADALPFSLERNLKVYQEIQQKLNLLNAYAVRINTMRKELVGTEMRIRHKNQLFQQLSKIGDSVFPKRKELIDQISKQFTTDVDTFIENNIEHRNNKTPLYALREEIKALQNAAKVLTINTQAFSSTRQHLSKAWDAIKGVLKERKKEKAELRVVSTKHKEEFMEKLQQFSTEFSEDKYNIEEAQQQLKQLNTLLRSLELDYNDVKFLKGELQNAREPLHKKQEEREQEIQRLQREKQEKRQQALDELKQKIDSTIESASEQDCDALNDTIEQIKVEIKELASTKYEQKSLEQQLKPLSDIIVEKREQALLNLSEDDQKALQQLKEVLTQRSKRRKEIKEQVEVCRREAASSGMDFEKAMAFNEQMQAEKERLEHINESIKEIETKITELESKV